MAKKQPPAYLSQPSDFDFAAGDRFIASLQQSTPPEPEKPSVARRIGDVGLSLGQGALGSFKSISDFFGADNPVSGGLDDASKFLGAQKSAQSQAATQASVARIKEAEASGSKLDEAQAYLGMLWDQPAEMIAQGVGSFATLGVGKVAQALKLAQAAKAAGVSKDVFLASGAAKQAVEEAAKFGFKTNIGLGAVQGVGAVKGSQFEQTYENARQQGMPEEEARALAAQAQEYGGAGTMQQVLGGVLGGVASATGPIERTLLGAGKKPVQSGVMSSVAKGFGKEFATEGGQGAQERFAGNDAAVDAGVLAPERRMQGVVGQGLMEGTIGGLLGGITGPLEGQAAALDPAVNPAKEAADTIRATEKVPESGALTRAVNAGVEAKAQAVEAGGLQLAPLVVEQTATTTNGLALEPLPGESAPEPVDDPVRDQILALPDGARQDALRAYAVVNRTDVAKGVQQYNRKLLDRLLAENKPEPEATPEIGDVVRTFDPASPPASALSLAPMGEVAYDNGIDFQPDSRAELASRSAELDKLTRRAPRTRTDGVGLNLQTDPVQNYLDNLRGVNTPAARAYVRDFDAGRITPADVQQRMQAEQGLTPEQRIARAAAEAPAQVDTVAERLRSAAAQGMATPAPTDILNPAGEPFKTKMAADRAAKKSPGAAVLPVADGGFLVRPKESVNVQDVPQAPEVSQAAPAVSPTGQAPQAVGTQPAGPTAGVPAEGDGAVEAAGLTENKVGRKDSAQIAQPENVVSEAGNSSAQPATPIRLGRNNTPLNEGGKPFKTRKAAQDAKKLQPMMRVVTVPNGYALAEKTPAQLAAEERASRRLRNPNTSAPGEPIPAHAFIAAAGGLSRAAAADMGVDGNPRIGNRTLFAGQGRGLSMEQATQILIQDGYLSEGASINDALSLIKTSLTRPQYNADGIERIAEAEVQAQFEDYLAAQEESGSEVDPWDDAPATATDDFSDDMLEASGYDAATDAIKAEVRALLEMANAQGIDTESIMLDAHERTRNATEQDYYEAAKTALEAAITGSNRDRSTPAGSESQGQGQERDAANQELNQPETLTVQAQAATESVAPGTLELAAQTPAEAAALQDAQEQAAKAEAAAKRAADAAAAKEEDRKRIAQASVRAADRFELGQDPLDSLTGQGSMFDDAPEQPRQAPEATKSTAQPITRADVTAAQQQAAPKLTQAEAKSLMAWEDLGQKDGVKTHALTFYESQADKDAKRGRMIVAKVSKGDRSATAWMVDGEDKTFGALAQAKKLAEEVGMAKAVADGFVEPEAAKPAATKPAAAPQPEAPAAPPINSISGRSVPLLVGQRLPAEVIAKEVENRIGQFAHQPRVLIRERAEGVLPGASDDDAVAGAVYDGAIYLFRDQLANRSEVRATLFHELLHYGLRRIFSRAQFIREMQSLYERDAWIKARADAWATSADGRRAALYGGEEYATARGVDEALARLAEPNAGEYTRTDLVSRAVAAVSTWLADVAQRLGFAGIAAQLRGMKNQEARALIQRVFSTLQTESDPTYAGWWDDAEPAYAKKTAGEPRNLVTLHNMTAENLAYADQLGGIPVPSIGITKVDSPFNGFGDITLIASNDMIDPKTGVPVYDRDAWTARFPTMNFKKVKAKLADAFYDRMNPVRELMAGDDDGFISQLWEQLRNASVQSPEKITSIFARYDAGRVMYAKEVLGKSIKVPMRNVRPSMPSGHDPQLVAYWKKNGAALMRAEHEMSGSQFSDLPQYKEFEEEIRASIRRYAEAVGEPEKADQYINRIMPDGTLGAGMRDRWIRDIETAGKKEVDRIKMGEAVDKAVKRDDPGYLRWVQSLVQPLFEAPTITLRGKEVPATLDNIVSAMTVGATAGVEKSMTFSPGKVAAMLGKRFKSLDEIKAARDRVVSQQAESESKNAADALLTEYRTHVSQFYTYKDWRGNIDTWAANDDSMEALSKAGKLPPSDANIRAALARMGFKGVDQQALDLARNAIEALRNAATDYFEAKPQRAVSLNEFKGAVVPKGTSAETIAILEKHGIAVEVHNKTEGAREKAIQKLAKRLDKENGGVLFSRTPPADSSAAQADSNARNAATQQLVDGLKAKWTRAPEIIVARNMQDAQIPQEVRDYDALLKSQGATGEPRGFIYKGKVYLLTDQLKGPQQIAEVLFHEVLGHYGLRGAFGDGLTPILKQLGALRRKEVVAKAREYGLFNKDALGGLDKAAASDSQIWDAMSDKQRLDAAEEVLAEMAQTQPTIGFVQRAIAAIRNWLRANVPGFKNLKLKDADIVQAYILPARAYVTRSNETAQQAIDRAMTDAGFSRTDDRINFSRTTAQSIASSMGDMTPDQEKAYKNVAGVKAVPTVRERMDALKANLGLKLRQGLVDQFAAIKQLDQNAYVQARMSKGTDGTLEAMLMYGKPFMRDGAPDVDVKDGGFAKVLASLKGEQDRWMMWIAAQRAEKLKAEGKENLMTDDDISALKTLNAGKMADGTARSPVYAKALQELNAYNDAMLKLAMDSGLIDKDAYDLMAGQPYVPFYRLMEEGDMKGPKFSSGLVNQKAWQKLKGGTQQLNADLLQNMLLNWSHLLQASAKNRAATATMDAAEKMAVAYKVDADTKGSVKVMRDGSAEHWMVEDPYLLDAISAIHYVPSPLMKPLAKFKQLLTWGVTVNPTFKIRNLIRDSVSAIAQSELGYNPGANVAKGWKLTAKDSQIYASMLASGGLIKFGTQENTDRLRAQVAKLGGVVLDKSGTERFFGQIKDLYDVYNEFGDRAENVNRAALYDALIKKGKTHAEAAFMARDLMDFSMGGSAPVVRFLTQAVPFLNARLVGLDKLGRAAMEDPRRFATVTGAVALASLALLAAYSDDDDWKKREDWDRDAYWWFKVGEQAYRIPKPFEVGAIGTLAERTAELMLSDEMTGKRYMERVSHMLSGTFSFNPVPQAFKPLLDLYANKDSFTGRAIESQADQRLRPQDRYSERTPEVAKFLGGLGLPDPAQLVKGEYSALSPKQVEHLIRGYFSWVGTAAMTVSDFGLRPLAGRGERPDMRLKDVFIAGNFVENLPTGSSRYVTQMYEQSRQVEQAYASYQEAIKAGDTEKAQSIKESAGPLLRNRPAYTAATRQLAEINRAAKRIEADQAMAGAAKRARLTQLEQQRQVIAQRVNRLAAATP